ncbi:MAG: hypothetical protein QXS29_05995 [Nitrososphaeria archaeon]
MEVASVVVAEVAEVALVFDSLKIWLSNFCQLESAATSATSATFLSVAVMSEGDQESPQNLSKLPKMPKIPKTEGLMQN